MNRRAQNLSRGKQIRRVHLNFQTTFEFKAQRKSVENTRAP